MQMKANYVEIENFQRDTGLPNELMKELYFLFTQELNEEKMKLNQWQTLKHHDLVCILHNIKGISSNYKAQRVSELAESLHKKIKNHDGFDCQYYVVALSEVIDETIKVITKYFI